MRTPWQRASRARRSLFLWAGLTLLLAVGVLFSISDLARMSALETLRANQQQQRIIIDPVSGQISGLSQGTPSAAFDVAETPAAPETPAIDQVPSAAPEAAQEPSPDYEQLRTDTQQVALPAVARSKESLLRAPAPEITEHKGKQLLPKIAEGDVRPSRLYARAFQRQEGQSRVAIVITDVGFSAQALQQILELPGQISVGFSPYAEQPDKQIVALRNGGHEVWTMLPMMSSRYPQDDPGPLGLIAALKPGGALARLRGVLASTLGSVGVILPGDENFSAQPLWARVRDEILNRGLLIMAASPDRALAQLSPDTAQQAQMQHADILLDSTPSAAFILSKLAGIKTRVAEDEDMVVLISARPQSLSLLKQWLNDHPLGENAVLAPLSAVYAPPAPPPAAEPVEETGHGEGH